MKARTLLRLLLAVTIAGIALSGFAGTSAAGGGETRIYVGDIYFCDPSYNNGVCETTIQAGDTVIWDFSPAEIPHTTTECGASCDDPTETPLWDSGVILGNEEPNTFSFQFDEPGVYLYYCHIHPFQQRGKIIVEAAPALAGDANCDGSVNSIDAALVLQYGAGLLAELPCQDNADVNGDGVYNSIDAALILQYVAGLLPSLPV